MKPVCSKLPVILMKTRIQIVPVLHNFGKWCYFIQYYLIWLTGEKRFTVGTSITHRLTECAHRWWRCDNVNLAAGRLLHAASTFYQLGLRELVKNCEWHGSDVYCINSRIKVDNGAYCHAVFHQTSVASILIRKDSAQLSVIQLCPHVYHAQRTTNL